MPSGFFPWRLRFLKLQKNIFSLAHSAFIVWRAFWQSIGKCNMTHLQLCKWKQRDFDNKDHNGIIFNCLWVSCFTSYTFSFSYLIRTMSSCQLLSYFLSISLMLAILISVILVDKIALWGPWAHNFGGPNWICTECAQNNKNIGRV